MLSSTRRPRPSPPDPHPFPGRAHARRCASSRLVTSHPPIPPRPAHATLLRAPKDKRGRTRRERKRTTPNAPHPLYPHPLSAPSLLTLSLLTLSPHPLSSPSLLTLSPHPLSPLSIRILSSILILSPHPLSPPSLLSPPSIPTLSPHPTLHPHPLSSPSTPTLYPLTLYPHALSPLFIPGAGARAIRSGLRARAISPEGSKIGSVKWCKNRDILCVTPPSPPGLGSRPTSLLLGGRVRGCLRGGGAVQGGGVKAFLACLPRLPSSPQHSSPAFRRHSRPPRQASSSPAFLATAFLATAFLATAFLATAFLATAILLC